MPRPAKPRLFGEYLNEFYTKLKKEDKSYSQQRIANDIGVNMRTFYSWIRGRKVPRHREIVPKIAQYFSNVLKENITADILNASIEAQIAQTKKPKVKKKYPAAKVEVAAPTPKVKPKTESISAVVDRIISELTQLKQYAPKAPEQLQEEEKELLENYRRLSAAAKKEIAAYCKFKSQQK